MQEYKNYLKELREIVGSRPLLSAGAIAAVINEKGEILLNLRSDTNTWGVPGGSMELGETFEETCIREMYEETGIKITKLKRLNVFSGPELYFKYPNGDELYSVTALFQAIEYSGELEIRDGESFELKFFDLDNLPNTTTSRAKHFLDWIRENRDQLEI